MPPSPDPAARPVAVPAAPALGGRVMIVMPAYNAALTLERTYADVPHDIVDRVILVDDVSRDQTVEIARRLGLEVIVHRQNRGYGGNQKTCYDAALEAGADVVVMLHPDYQYDATRIPALVEPILRREVDLMLGSRFLGDPLAGGMPRWKFVSNRFLTTLENAVFGLRLSEYHTGFRAYSRHLLETIPYHRNSDDFVFDQELVAQAVAAGLAIGEIAVPTRYFAEASSVGLRRSIVYGLSTLRVCARFALHRIRVRPSPKLTPRRRGSAGDSGTATDGRSADDVSSPVDTGTIDVRAFDIDAVGTGAPPPGDTGTVDTGGTTRPDAPG
jgi:glycosyltransferase involved in cell wall biosynthesis